MTVVCHASEGLLRRPLIAGLVLLACLNSAAGASDHAPASFFDRPTLLKIEIEIPTNDVASLRERPRDMVSARLVVQGRVFPRVGVRVKGGQGSYRPVDEKPAWTLDFNQFTKGQTLDGFSKLHLNNSVQDSTYLCEDLSAELFRRAGVPAPRIAWGTIQFNGRNLGLYVVKEGITKRWLKEHFGDGGGNLYDSGTHQEVNQPLRLDSGSGADGQSDLRALAAAAGVQDATERWTALQKTLDTARFMSFMACEVLANHTDGYSLMQNNYRIYFPPGSSRAVFLPQGMDRMFWEPAASLEPKMKALVASAAIETPQGNALFRTTMKELVEHCFEPGWITNRIEAVLAVVGPVEPLAARDAGLLRARILERINFARKETAGW